LPDLISGCILAYERVSQPGCAYADPTPNEVVLPTNTSELEQGVRPDEEEFPVPYLGRTVRIVGPVGNRDPNNNPHAKVRRGEMGKALYNFMHNSISAEPIIRATNAILAADQDNILNLRRIKLGKVRPGKPVASNPAAMTEHIKRVARALGFDVVSVGKSHPSFLYAGITTPTGDAGERPVETPQELARQFPFFIVGSVAWDHELIQAHRHHIGDAAYELAAQKTNLIYAALEGYIHELGYRTLRGAMNGQAGAVASGLGELGRNGLVITPEYGARIHLSDLIMTDLPLLPGEPIDIGVEDFCKVCRKCATTCPTNSITFDDKVVENGVEKYKINWETCYKLRGFVVEHWSVCLTCAVVCPFTKRLAWWHRLAVWSLRTTPRRARAPVVAALKWLDDRIWGEVARKRVRWLGYDSGVKPGERACTIPGCSAEHEDRAFIALDDIGYYAPLKENTNRFAKR
jgi:reductive dehalogenase